MTLVSSQIILTVVTVWMLAVCLQVSTGQDECPDGYFTCAQARPGQSHCVPQDKVCDGISDCEKADDELQDHCSFRRCSSYSEFRCSNGLCINRRLYCDHNNDCGDGSDEGSMCDYRDCVVSEEFRCGNGRCISRTLVCDGNNDCRDNTDETTDDCNAEQSCPDNFFRCDGQSCIPNHEVCDDKLDCNDKSDEVGCDVNECESFPCQTRCVDTKTSFYCTCDIGFSLTNGVNCSNINECEETPQVCDQLCTDTIGSYTCGCAPGYLRNSNDVTCVHTEGGDPKLIFANRYYVRESGVEAEQEYKIVVQDFDFVVALDFDWTERTLYFSDVLKNQMFRMNMDGTGLETIIYSGVPDVEGLAVDWVGRKLYYTDRALDILQVAEMNGKSRKTLLRDYLVEPRAVVVHPRRGYIFWTDWGFRSYIGRLGMDGSDLLQIHNRNIVWPNGITIDYTTDKLYWTDASLDHLSYSNLDGSNMHEFINDDSEHTIAHPFGITIFEDQVYWTDWNEKTVYRAHKFTGDDMKMIRNTTHRPLDIVVVHPLRQDSSIPNPCGTNNGGCADLCLLSPSGERVCACPDHHVMWPDGRCIQDCNFPGQHYCAVDQYCYPFYLQCDGKVDCSDGSDEMNCPERVCPEGLYQCPNGECIYNLWICDGDDDCGDNDDEAICEDVQCSPWEFRCNNGRCIPEDRVCDLRNDCQDMSDEDLEYCESMSCGPDMFSCDNGYCIPLSWVCDLDNDCSDNSDEPHAQCQSQSCPPGWFSCASNYRCIPEYFRCNGRDDCRDNSDEKGCYEVTCDPLGEYRCNNHRCIPERWFCDFENDCGDFSDEYVGCVPRECSESEFRCTDNRCIRGFWQCDGNFDCADGLDEDPAMCQLVTCSPDEFKCNMGSCISASLTCDRTDDCSDGSDEFGCELVTCSPDEFKCNMGSCISANLTCDRTDDCSDGSDEFGCEYDCRSSEFQCANSRCIPGIDRCDGQDDCGDGSDELRDVCLEISCNRPEHFSCGDGTCIWNWQVCDGFQNCPDSSDESREQCGRCGNDQFQCRGDRECIPKQNRCNQERDCEDGSDEENCYRVEQGNCDDNNNCEQTCTDDVDLNGYHCSCNRGYNAVGPRCIDIDECASNPCPQRCDNIKGSYECSCAPGFRDVSPGRTRGAACRSEDEKTIVIIGDGTEIRKYDVENEKYDDLVQLHTGHIDGLDFHPQDPVHIYFVDNRFRSVEKIHLEGDLSSASNNLGIDDIHRPRGLAVDWLTGNKLYFTDLGVDEQDLGPLGRRRRASSNPNPKIAIATLDGSHEMTVFVGPNISYPTEITLNPRKGLMYWIDLGIDESSPSIAVAGMDGSNYEQLVSSRLLQPSGLAVDFANNDTLYWCDAKKNSIEFVFSDGSGRRVIAESFALSNPLRIEVFGSYIYWTTSSLTERGTVKRKNKTGVVETPQIYLTGFNKPTGIRIFNKQRYPSGLDDPCRRAPCSHFCLLRPGTTSLRYTCACPSGESFEENSRTICTSEPFPRPPDATTTVSPARCQNGVNKAGSCLCSSGYEGVNCETFVGQPSASPADPTVAILLAVIAIVVILALLLATLLFMFIRKRAKRPSQGAAYYSSDTNVVLDAGGPVVSTVSSNAHTSYDNPQYTPDVADTGGAQAVGGVDVVEYANIAEKAGLPEKVGLPYNHYVPPEYMPQMHPIDPPPAYSAAQGGGDGDFDELPIKQELQDQMQDVDLNQ